MRAFILRRMELVASGVGDVVLIGSMHSVDTLRIKEFLTRNNHPYQYVDLDKDADVQVLLDRFHVKVEDVPVLICRGQHVLRNPSVRTITDCLGFNEEIERTHVRDLIVVGAGPSGLAAAVYAASEGLDVLVIECNAPGGQAGASSRIENYLGFPEGITGQQLANSAYTQARKFGAEIMIARTATRLTCDRRPYSIQIDDDTKLPAKSVIIATGAEYRRPSLQNLERFEGAGVYYGATFVEAQLCGGEEVIVVGGGNSAGQAAVFLAQTAKKVHIMVRARGLAESMSRYLIRRIEEHPSIELHTRTDMVALEGSDHVERVRWRNGETGQVETYAIRHVFIMTGALPKTGWLDGCVTLDEKGFIKTGQQLSQTELSSASWPLARPPHLLETSLPGIFAVGDVRAGNVKRVASAVGEGSIAVSFVHQVLRE
jgi:thioredoxin reductase (NADPH)